MEEDRKNVLRQQAGKKLLGGLLVDIVDVCGAEILGFLVGLGSVGRLDLDSGGERSFGGAFLSAVEGSSAPVICWLPISMSGSSFSTTRRCEMTDLNSL